MVINHASSYSWLRQDHGYTPCQVMIDSSDAEIAGIKTAFDDDTKIVICQWHILKPGGKTSDVFEEACREFEEYNGVADDVWDGSALVVISSL
ncbi:hypothetical protein BC941DRAFT_413998 [Chlamydoabsidia padenii]|nr:hypothetical protein BC941DRAFT_413998 [Chlamydoabsidia padenii]